VLFPNGFHVFQSSGENPMYQNQANSRDLRHFQFLLIALAMLAVVLLPVQSAYGDNLYASIRGTVTDPSGAVVAGAKLTATNVATGISYNATSTDSGAFSFLQLPIGDYSVRVEKSGFKTFTEGRIHLDLDQIFSLKVTLEVGTTSETITVEANPAQVETTSMQLSTVVTGNQIVDLPLNGRSWIQLMQLQPGVQGASDRFGNNAGADTYATNGSSTQQNSFLVNGTDTNDISLNTPAIIPSPDAIGEFDLVTSTINPEYGRNSGAVINAAIKSGTNQFHGDVFEFYRDTFLDSKTWFETTPSPFHQHTYGGVIGGPIVKDHAFFFFSYQGRRSRRPEPLGFGNAANNIFVNVLPVVPSAPERTGDFSAATGSLPFTCPITGLCAAPFPMVGADGKTHPAGTPYATLFPTGAIPAADLNPIAVALMNKYVPLPNAANNQYVFNPGQTSGADQYLGRLDEKISSKDAVWFYGLYENDTQLNDLPFIGSDLRGFGETDPNKNYEFTAAWNHTFSPTMLNEARVAYLRYNFQAVYPQKVQQPSDAGFSINPQSKAGAGLPVVSLAGFFALGFSEDGPQPRMENIYQAVDNLSKVMGHHTMKFGFNMDRIQLNNPFYFDQDGAYTFNGAGLFSTGNGEADFLLGIPDSYFQSSGGYTSARAREYYAYAQDQWQVRPNLTLTFGLAWDLETPYSNNFAKGEGLTSFKPGEQSKVFSSAPVGIVFPGDPGVGKYGLASLHYDNFAPRLGFAWSPGSSHNWSVRGGIGLYYNRIEEETLLQTLTDPPFSLGSGGFPTGLAGSGNTTETGVPSFANPFATVWSGADGATLNNGKGQPVTLAGGVNASFPNTFPFAPPAPGATNINWPLFEPLGVNFAYFAPNTTSPRSTNFNLTVQRQLGSATVASLGYVGSIGRHEEGAADIANPAGMAPGVNPAAAAAGCADFDLPTCAPQTFAFNPFVYGQPGVIFTGINSNYNSLQASIQRHMSNGLQFQVSYTYSRAFDQGSNYENASSGVGYNVFNFARSYGPSANDAPQRLVINYLYTLPIFKYTHRFKQLTDGWNLTGIATFQSGFPVNVQEIALSDLQVAAFSGFAYGFDAPDFVNTTGQPLNINRNPRNGKPWVNPAAFAVPALGTIGNANRNPFYGPGLNYWDMALEKDIIFTESKRLELRWETFDTFNHANFGTPNNAFGTPTFGQVSGVNTAISAQGDGRVVQLGAKVYF
jgi:hypothetical protein